MTAAALIADAPAPPSDDERNRHALLGALRIAHVKAKSRRRARSRLKQRIMSYYRLGLLSMAKTGSLIDTFALREA